MKHIGKACGIPSRCASETIWRASIGVGLLALVLGTQGVLVLLLG